MKLHIGKLYEYVDQEYWGKEIILYVGTKKRKDREGNILLFMFPDGTLHEHYESCWVGEHWKQVGK